MTDKNISLKDRQGSNNLEAYNLEGRACIEVFEFECELSKEDTVRLRDFLNTVIDA